MTYDVAIAGAGPAGLICGTELERLGKKTVVLERHKAIGEPVECAGLVNIDGLKRLGIGKGDYVLNEVMGAKLIAPSGASVEIRGKENKAYVIGRGVFDRFLADRYNGELMLGRDVRGAKQRGSGYVLDTDQGEIEAENLVIATGPDQRLHKSLNLVGPGDFISTSQYEIEGMNLDPSFVELYFGSLAPGFFAWVIPVNESTARVGLGLMEGSASEKMSGFLARLKKEGRFKEGNKIVHKSGGLIPLFNPNIGPAFKNAFLVGDAAGQVKATTGGGVVTGGLAAKALAEAIASETPYEDGLASLYKELGNHLMIRKVMSKLGDEQYENMMVFLNKPEIKAVIEEHGDMDFVGPLMQHVMKNPAILMQAMKFMGGGLLF
jgi:digeranylgeranylglycerophospholipid reductase